MLIFDVMLKRVFLLLFFYVFAQELEAAVLMNCKFRYMYRKKMNNDIQVGTYKGSVIGEVPIYAPNSNPDHIDVWTNIYAGKVLFRTGYEINTTTNSSLYDDKSIVATVYWSNGGYSTII